MPIIVHLKENVCFSELHIFKRMEVVVAKAAAENTICKMFTKWHADK